MGRSVSTPPEAIAVAYQSHYFDDLDDYGDTSDDIRQTICHLWPSMTPCNHWVGREDYALAQNRLAYAGISEYCGVLAVWLMPIPGSDHPDLAEEWCRSVAPRFERTFGDMVRVGTASNGMTMYRHTS